jgi:hypothetical protein
MSLHKLDQIFKRLQVFLPRKTAFWKARLKTSVAEGGDVVAGFADFAEARLK